MSKFVDEILNDIKTNPLSFTDYKGFGIIKDNIIVSGYGNTAICSCIDVRVNLKYIPITYVDRWKLEIAIRNWYKNASIELLSK